MVIYSYFMNFFFFLQNCINHPLWYEMQLVREKKINYAAC